MQLVGEPNNYPNDESSGGVSSLAAGYVKVVMRVLMVRDLSRSATQKRPSHMFLQTMWPPLRLFPSSLARWSRTRRERLQNLMSAT